MGRTKVQPGLRRRVVKACGACKTSKRRCDGQNPCNRCSRQQRAAECIYHNDEANPLTPTSQRRSQLSDADRTDLDGGLTNSNRHFSTLSPAASHLTQESPSILGPAREETFFVGPSAALSFVHLLRKIFTRRAVRSGLDITTQPDAAAKQDSAGQPGHCIPVLRDGKLLDSYIENYLSITSGIFYVISKDDICNGLQAEAARGLQTSAYIVVAIGSRANASNTTDRAYTDAYIQIARQRLTQDFLLDPTVDQAVAFLLMAFYALLCHQRNPAYMHLGHAVRCAHALGLHQLAKGNDHDEGIAAIWMSICVMDVAVCSILGRPSGVGLTLPKSREVSLADISDCHTEVATLSKAFAVIKIIEEAMRDTHAGDPHQARDAENFLQRLTIWRKSISQGLEVDGTDGMSSPRLTIAEMNISCLYYHGVILITRPYLIAVFDHKSQHFDDPAIRYGMDNSLPEVAQATDLDRKLAEVCTDAAIYMIETVHKTWKAGILLSNMCFTKAWVFAAGLVLGFSMLIQPLASTEVKRSMDQAIHYLQAQSSVSPYARQYHNILVDIMASISAYHDRQTEQRRAANSGLFGRVTQLETDRANSYDNASLGAAFAEPTGDGATWDSALTENAEDIFLTPWDISIASHTFGGEYIDAMWPDSLLDTLGQ